MHAPHRFVRSVALLTALATSAGADALVLTVGPATDCQYPTPQQALDALPAGTSHELRLMQGLHIDQWIRFASRQVRIVGGYASCSATTPTGATTLSGVGGPRESVIEIAGEGNAVVLERLTIRGGDESADGVGGGIEFGGGGSLLLRSTVVTDNYAGYGGGIDFDGTRGSVLTLARGTLILSNTAQVSGGGVRVAGESGLRVAEPEVWIDGNRAIEGYGGGIEIFQVANAHLSSPGYSGSGLVTNNIAKYGGGIAIIADRNYLAGALLFTSDERYPVRIRGNRATHTGGGLWVGGYRTALCAYDFVIDGNFAQEGSAIYLDRYDGRNGEVILNGGGRTCANQRPAAAKACAPGVTCNLISGNVTETAAGAPTAGATVLVQNEGLFDAHRVRFVGNRGAHVLRTFQDSYVRESLIAGNTVTSVIRVEPVEYADGPFRLWGTTIAHNTISGPAILSVADDLALDRSILWQPGKTTLQQSAGTRTSANLLVSEYGSVHDADTASIAIADPRFVDPERGDFRLRATSPALDFAPATSAVDLDGRSRNVSLPVIASRYGPVDLGAHERPSLWPLVLNGMFDANLAPWRELQAGVSSHDGAQNVASSPDAAASGALLVSAPNPGPRTYARGQCVHLPAPGRYTLNGYGRSAGQIGQRDRLVLDWAFRRAGGEACSAGPPDRQGTHVLTSSAAWVRPAAPTIIDVSAAEWTTSSSIDIVAVVEETEGVSLNPAAYGWFDGITLELGGFQPTLLSDGFE